MRKVVLLFFFCWLFIPIYAQNKDPNQGYMGYIDVTVGAAYNFNTAQTISTNNMQWYSMISTTHGYHWKGWFVGTGVGYYYSFRDKENMYPFYVAGRYRLESNKVKPFIEVRAGVIYDPHWIERVQKYGAFCVGVSVFKGLQVGLRGSIFSRPSRFFTANAAIVICYEFGK